MLKPSILADNIQNLDMNRWHLIVAFICGRNSEVGELRAFHLLRYDNENKCEKYINLFVNDLLNA